MVKSNAIVARLLPAAGWQLAALGGATALVGILSAVPAVGDTSSIYLLAVALVAIRRGTREALVTAAFSFLLYNYLFVEPRFTLVVASRESVVTLLLLLFLGVVIGRLAGTQHDRAEEAARHASVVASLAAVSRHLATAPSTREALGPILDELVSAAGLARAWIGLGIAPSQESLIADSRPDEERPSPRAYHTARRTQDQVEWIRVSEPAIPHARRPDVRARSKGVARPAESALFRVEVAAGDDAAGSLWFQLPDDDRRPNPAQDRMVLAVAEQIGQSLLRDRLAQQAMDAQIATRSDELKSALLDSVSHDLRTPLASIRASAGNLADPDLDLRDAERREAARAIDHEATRLSRLVSGLLDMSRIRAGSLRPVAELVPIEDLVRGIVDRSRDRLDGRELKLEIRSELSPVEVDPVLVDQVITNLVDNAITHTGRTAPIRVSVEDDGAFVRVVVEDGGPGVAAAELQRIFEPFVRGEQTDGSANGAGLGLAVSRGLAEAMGGHISAGASDLGGLRVVLDLPAEP